MGFVLDVEERRRMVDARGRTHDDRRMVALGQLESGLDHVKGLLGRGRIKHRHLGKRCEPTGVLLGLRRNGTGVVGDDQHEAAAHAHVVQAHERVARDVETHLLAGKQPAGPCERGAEQQLERNFLVSRPLDMHAVRRARSMQTRHGLDDLGGRRTRITRHDAHASLERCVCHRFIAHQELLRHETLSLKTKQGTRYPVSRFTLRPLPS